MPVLFSDSRPLAQAGNELYIVSGGQGTSVYIAAGHVSVPTYTRKVIEEEILYIFDLEL